VRNKLTEQWLHGHKLFRVEHLLGLPIKMPQEFSWGFHIQSRDRQREFSLLAVNDIQPEKPCCFESTFSCVNRLLQVNAMQIVCRDSKNLQYPKRLFLA